MPLAQSSLFDFIAKRQQANPYNEANTGPLQLPAPRRAQPSRAPTQEFMFVNEPQQTTTTTTGATTTTTTTTTTTIKFVNGDTQIIYRNYTNVPCTYTLCEGVLTVEPASASTRREIQTTEPAPDGLPLEVAVRNAPPASVALPRQSYTIAQKLRLLQEFRKVGGKQAAFAAKHNMRQQTLSLWLKEEKHLLTLKARGFGKCKRKGIEEDEADDEDVAAEFEKDVDADALGDSEDTEPEAAPLAPTPALAKIPVKRVRPAAGPAPVTRHRTDSPNCAFCDKLDDEVTRTCKKCPAKFHHFCVINLERYGEDEVEDLCPRCHPSWVP
jgi:hypothetical protein